MSTKRLNLLDTAWLSAQKNVVPMQVGGSLAFALPADAPRTGPLRPMHDGAMAPVCKRLCALESSIG